MLTGLFLFSDITHARFTPNTGGNQGNAKPVMQNTVETFLNQSLKNPAFSQNETNLGSHCFNMWTPLR